MAYTISENCTGCTACAGICPVQAISGEKKSLHAIDPGPCIQCGACGRICPAGAVSDHFGIVISRVPRKAWPRPLFDLAACMSCGICLETCPAGVISQSLQQVGSRHLFPYLADGKGCIACGFCAQDCPVDAVTMAGPEEAAQDKANRQTADPEKADAKESAA